MADRFKELSTGRLYFDKGVSDPARIIKIEHTETDMEEVGLEEEKPATGWPATLNFLDNGPKVAGAPEYLENGDPNPEYLTGRPIMIVDPAQDRVIINNLVIKGQTQSGVNVTEATQAEVGDFATLTASVYFAAPVADIDELTVKTIKVKEVGVAEKFGFGSGYGAWTQSEESIAGNFAPFANGGNAPVHILHGDETHDISIGNFSDGDLTNAHLLVGKSYDGIGIDRNQIAKAGGNFYIESAKESDIVFKNNGYDLMRLKGNGTQFEWYTDDGNQNANWEEVRHPYELHLFRGSIPGRPATVEWGDSGFGEFKDKYANGPNSYWSLNVSAKGRLYFENYWEPWDDAAHPPGDASGQGQYNILNGYKEQQPRAYLQGSIEDNAITDLTNFTGQHRCLPSAVTSFSKLSQEIGKIVVSDGKQHSALTGRIMTGTSHTPERRKVNISDARPKVKLSSLAYQKSVFGVVAEAEDENNPNREYANGAFVTVVAKDNNDHRIVVNSLGEGGIWVCNANGNLENGDYITTSNITGYGMKQDDDILHNYTVAKITMDCNFDLDIPAAQEQLNRETEKEARTTKLLQEARDADAANSEITRLTELQAVAKTKRLAAEAESTNAQGDYDCRVLTSEESQLSAAAVGAMGLWESQYKLALDAYMVAAKTLASVQSQGADTNAIAKAAAAEAASKLSYEKLKEEGIQKGYLSSSVALASSQHMYAGGALPSAGTPALKSTGKKGITPEATSEVRVAFVSCTYHCG